MRSNTLITEFIETLDDLNLNGKMIPGLIMSSPGFGKTSTVELYCKVKDYNCCTLIPSHYSPDDILGLQSLVNGELVRLAPSWYKTLLDMASEKRTLLFIDELSTCDEFIQAPLLRLVFERKLDDKPLPDNVFIVSAGNYANELNNQFHLAAPTVNRFMILNLSSADYNIMEVCDDKFSRLAKSGDTSSIMSYLNTSKIKDGASRRWDFDKLRNFISKHFTFNKPTITDSTEDGLIGYCSIRSLSYSLSFMQSYASQFTGDLWIRVLGDTLGRYREKPARGYFDQNRDLFLTSSSVGGKETFDLKGKIGDFFMGSNEKVQLSGLKDIISWMNRTDKSHTTPVELDMLRKFIQRVSDISYINKLNSGFKSPEKNEVITLIPEAAKIYKSRFA